MSINFLPKIDTSVSYKLINANLKPSICKITNSKKLMVYLANCPKIVVIFAKK